MHSFITRLPSHQFVTFKDMLKYVYCEQQLKGSVEKGH